MWVEAGGCVPCTRAPTPPTWQVAGGGGGQWARGERSSAASLHSPLGPPSVASLRVTGGGWWGKEHRGSLTGTTTLGLADGGLGGIVRVLRGRGGRGAPGAGGGEGGTREGNNTPWAVEFAAAVPRGTHSSLVERLGAHQKRGSPARACMHVAGQGGGGWREVGERMARAAAAPLTPWATPRRW